MYCRVQTAKSKLSLLKGNGLYMCGWETLDQSHRWGKEYCMGLDVEPAVDQ